MRLSCGNSRLRKNLNLEWRDNLPKIEGVKMKGIIRIRVLKIRNTEANIRRSFAATWRNTSNSDSPSSRTIERINHSQVRYVELLHRLSSIVSNQEYHDLSGGRSRRAPGITCIV